MRNGFSLYQVVNKNFAQPDPLNIARMQVFPTQCFSNIIRLSTILYGFKWDHNSQINPSISASSISLGNSYCLWNSSAFGFVCERFAFMYMWDIAPNRIMEPCWVNSSADIHMTDYFHGNLPLIILSWCTFFSVWICRCAHQANEEWRWSVCEDPTVRNVCLWSGFESWSEFIC